MMGIFFFEENPRRKFDAPQYTRNRHRFRGPRESEKINLEINQTLFSIKKLYEKNEKFRDNFINHATLLLGGGDSGVNDEGNNPLVLLGLENLIVRIDQLERRLKALEA
jgi:hypothetical protein